jgi:RyR domain
MMLSKGQIARVCHEANRAYCEAIGDDSQKSWIEAEEWQRESAIRGIEVALAGATPKQQHEAWAKDKITDGWIYGETKDPEAKTHPCLVAYEDLPDEQKVKDALYIGVVNALALGVTP